MLNPGDTIGRFEITAELGRGAMGVVYNAIDPHLDRQVAIKVLSPALAADEEVTQRFTNEARNASRLLHQNIATVFEAGPSPSGWYVAFEFVEGPTLRALLTDGPLESGLAADYLRQIASGLTAAHKAGIVHRDLKPDNLIITPEGTVKITDFGIAKKMGDPGQTRAGTILGTAYYMAPEQARGLQVDGRADWFSLGVIGYEMVTGKRPFDGYHEMAVLYSVVNDDPTPVESLNSDVPSGMATAIGAMLQKGPDERLSTLDALMDVLGGSAGSTTTTGRAVAQPSTGDIPLLAVLPLENKSPDPDFAFLAEGFAEDIGAALAQSRKFRVVAHDKIIAARSEKQSIDDWARRVEADKVLHGSLFRAGDRMKLRLTLRDLATDSQEWSQSFSGHKDDIFDIQDRVAAEVAEALGAEGERVVAGSQSTTHNSDAYEFLLRGRDYYRREGRENLEFAIRMFDQALELDPKYASALAAQADAYAQMYLMYFDRDQKWLRKAETAAKAALIIDKELPEAHRALARVMMEYGRKEEAIQELKTAIDSNPDYHEAYRTLGWIYQGMGQYEDSITYGQKSLRIKPLDRESYLLMGLNYLDLRDWDKARHHLERAIELSPDYGRAYMHLGNVQQKLGDLPGALKMYKSAMKYLTDNTAFVDLGWAQLLMGDYHSARESYEHLITEGAFEFTAFYHIGLIDKLEGNGEKATARFESTISVTKKQLAQDQDNPYGLMALALAQAQLGMTDEARRNAKRSVALEQHNGAMHLEYARVMAVLGDEYNAIATLKQSFTEPMGPSLFEVQKDPHFSEMNLSPLTQSESDMVDA